jgi:hypothetical protein
MTGNRMFPLNIQSSQHSYYSAKENETWLWYAWYGHLNFKCLKTLHDKIIVRLSQITCIDTIYEDYVINNQHRDSFIQKKITRACKPLQVDPLQYT